MVYNIGLISVIYQHELVVLFHMSPPSWISLPPPTHSHPSMLLQSSSLSSLSHRVNSHWLFAYVSVYASMLLSPFLSLSPSSPPPSPLSLFSKSASPLLLCEQIHQYHPSRSHIYVLICNIYFSFLTYFTLYNRL